MNLTPASLKTLRRKVFKHSKYHLSQTLSSLCVFAPLREPLFQPAAWHVGAGRLGTSGVVEFQHH